MFPFTFDRRERFILKTLRKLTKQRVGLVLQSGDTWVVEFAISQDDEGVAEALRTCHLRGWVEILRHGPHAQLEVDSAGNQQLPRAWAGTAPIYRLTDSGWNQVRGVHSWLVLTAIVAVATLCVTVVALLLQLYLSAPTSVVIVAPPH
jgi:hypothetical protein